MKNAKLILLLATLLLGVGCAKELKPGDGQVATPPVVNPSYPLNAPPGQGAGSAGDSWSYGSTVDFKPDSMEMFAVYVASHPLNAPSGYKLNVNVVDVGGGHFGGQIKLGYSDNGKWWEGYFAAGTGTNQSFDSFGTNRDVGLYHAQYNSWFNSNNNFTGFFQDSMGAIILVIDQAPNLGDGQLATSVSGSIWFKNFTQQFSTQGAERYCWFIYRGPYDCRSDIVINKSGAYPTDGGYRRLGTFTGLTRAKAFNQ